MGGEQSRWEEERLGAAALRFGAKAERERGMKEENEKYQLVLEEDEMISFVSTITMKGTLMGKVRVRPMPSVFSFQAWGVFLPRRYSSKPCVLLASCPVVPIRFTSAGTSSNCSGSLSAFACSCWR